MTLALIAFFAFTCEALAGFGGTVLALALGAQRSPLGELLAILIPANLALSTAVWLRHRDAVDWRLLTRRIGPAMAAGLPLGLVFTRVVGRVPLPAFALVVMMLGALQLWHLKREPGSHRGGSVPLLVLAGIVHGAWGSGGPLVVFATANDLGDKQAFRATLAVLWLALNGALLVALAAAGGVNAHTLGWSLILLPVVAVALALGEACAARVPERPFRAVGAALLGAAGLALLCRGS